MYQNVLINDLFTIDQVNKKYNDSLIELGNKVLANFKFGVEPKVNKLSFIRLKNLVKILSNDFINKDTKVLNKLVSLI